MEILYYGSPILRQKSKQVGIIDENIKKILDEMEAVVLKAQSVGLSAIQVGIPQRLVIVDRGGGLAGSPCIVKIINPKIVMEEGSILDNEGCLSFPELALNIKRPQSLTVEGLDENDEYLTIKCDEILSRIVAHEVDHLDGRLFIDRASQLEKLKFLRWHKKIKRFSKARPFKKKASSRLRFVK